MTSEELIKRAKDRLNNLGNPEFPIDETMAAIIQLGKNLEIADVEKRTLAERNTNLETKVGRLEEELETVKIELRRAYDEKQEQSWLARELGNFVGDIANSIYEGQEVAAANRIYELNSKSLKKKRINAYDYETFEEAKQAYIDRTIQPYDEESFIDWLFSVAKKA